MYKRPVIKFNYVYDKDKLKIDRVSCAIMTQLLVGLALLAFRTLRIKKNNDNLKNTN